MKASGWTWGGKVFLRVKMKQGGAWSVKTDLGSNIEVKGRAWGVTIDCGVGRGLPRGVKPIAHYTFLGEGGEGRGRGRMQDPHPRPRFPTHPTQPRDRTMILGVKVNKCGGHVE